MKRKIWLFIFVLVLIISLTSCKKAVGSPEDNAAAALGEQGEEENLEEYKFGFSGMSMENPYFIILEASIRESIEDEGYELITMDPGNDAITQNRQLQSMMEQGVQTIFLTPVDWEKITPTLKLLKNAGITVVNIDSQVKEMDYIDAYIGSDNYKAGVLCAESLIEKKPEGCKIVILESNTQNSIIERVSGFEATLAESQIPFEIIDRANTSGEFSIALESITKILNEQEEFDMIMCGNDQIAVAAIAALNVACATNPNLEDVIIYSVDGSPDIKKELQKKESSVAGTVAQFPIHIGKTSVQIALDIKNDEDFETITLEDVSMIDSENLSMYGVDGWQ